MYMLAILNVLTLVIVQIIIYWNTTLFINIDLKTIVIIRRRLILLCCYYNRNLTYYFRYIIIIIVQKIADKKTHMYD